MLRLYICVMLFRHNCSGSCPILPWRLMAHTFFVRSKSRDGTTKSSSDCSWWYIYSCSPFGPVKLSLNKSGELAITLTKVPRFDAILMLLCYLVAQLTFSPSPFGATCTLISHIDYGQSNCNWNISLAKCHSLQCPTSYCDDCLP